MNDFPRKPHLVVTVKDELKHVYGYRPPLEASHHYWVDGFPVTEQLYVFCTAYRKVSPHVKFLATYGNNTALSTYESGQFLGHVYSDVFVYSDASEYIMGRIAHQPDEGGFSVESHKIANDRFSAGNKGYYRLASTDVKRAIKNANKYIGAWSLVDIAGRSSNNFASKSKRVMDKAQSDIAGLARIDRLTLAHEIANLRRQGVQFLSTEVQSFADRVQDLIDEYNRLKKYNGFAAFVSIRILKSGKQMADISYTNAYDFDRNKMLFATKPVEELDADLAGKLAALSMVESGAYVDNIGYRVTEQSFWVECRDV